MLAAGRAVQLCLKRVCGMSLSLQAAGVSSLHSLPWHKEGGGCFHDRTESVAGHLAALDFASLSPLPSEHDTQLAAMSRGNESCTLSRWPQAHKKKNGNRRRRTVGISSRIHCYDSLPHV